MPMRAVEYEIENGVATITMNDGRANIMNAPFVSSLMAAFEKAERDEAAVVLRSGLPTIYSAGFDVRVFAARDAEEALEMVKTGGELVYAMLTFSRPIVAVAQGHVFPMGLFTLLAADYRIADDQDFRWVLNEVEIGIVPPLYAFRLLQGRLSAAWVARALSTAERFSAKEGLEAGVFHEIASTADLNARTRAVAARLAALPSAAFDGIKQRLNADIAAEIRSVIDSEQTLSTYEKLLRAG